MMGRDSAPATPSPGAGWPRGERFTNSGQAGGRRIRYPIAVMFSLRRPRARRVPALVLALGFTMPEAIGTSLLVIAINSVVALTTRLQAGSIEWGTVIPFTIASLIGVVVGSRLASTRDSSSLQRWFVGLLVVVAVYTAVRSGLALT